MGFFSRQPSPIDGPLGRSKSSKTRIPSLPVSDEPRPVEAEVPRSSSDQASVVAESPMASVIGAFNVALDEPWFMDVDASPGGTPVVLVPSSGPVVVVVVSVGVASVAVQTMATHCCGASQSRWVRHGNPSVDPTS